MTENSKERQKGVIIKRWICGGFAVATALILVWNFGKSELAEFLAYLLGGGLLIWQVRNASRRATAAEKVAEATESGNVAERFKNAIEHLGNEATSVRLGGIYALQNIAEENKKYREQIFNILCAHIVEITTATGYKPQKHVRWRRKFEFEGGFLGDSANEIVSMVCEIPTPEIQTILKLLFVAQSAQKIYQDYCANLASANLRGANFFDWQAPESNDEFSANLEKADLTDTDLCEANLCHVNLQGALLGYAKLKKAHLQGANLTDAYFDHTEMQDTEFLGANLQCTNFNDADLQEANFIMYKNLTLDQLLKAKTLYKAKLPNEMEEKILAKKPELLDPPSDENQK